MSVMRQKVVGFRPNRAGKPPIPVSRASWGPSKSPGAKPKTKRINAKKANAFLRTLSERDAAIFIKLRSAFKNNATASMPGLLPKIASELTTPSKYCGSQAVLRVFNNARNYGAIVVVS